MPIDFGNEMTLTAPKTIIMFSDGIEAEKIVAKQFRLHDAEVAQTKAAKEASQETLKRFEASRFPQPC
jgi:hypothetical protein